MSGGPIFFDCWHMSQHKTYSIFTIANWFLHRTICDQKKLQKLCYYAQARSLAQRNQRLINANFEAWVHGPVNAELWYFCHACGCTNLPEDYFSQWTIEPIEEADANLLVEVLKDYGNLSSSDLELMSHAEQPWILARGGCSETEICHTVISDDSMQKYYSLTSNNGVRG